MPDDKKQSGVNRAKEAAKNNEKAAESGKPESGASAGASGQEADPKLREAKEAAQAAAGEHLDDKLMQPGALEVEDMPESSELQERREKTKDLLQGMVSDDELNEEMTAAFSDDDSGIMDLLSEANLSPRHLKFCCGGVGVLLVLAGIVWGAIRVVPMIGDIDFGDLLEGDEEPADEQDSGESQEDDDEDDSDDSDEENDSGSGSSSFDVSGFVDDNDFLDVTIYSGVLMGEELTGDDGFTSASEDLGGTITDDALAQMIVDFSGMYELLQVDVQELLDQSGDRQETLDDFLHELRYGLYLGEQNLEQLESESRGLSSRYSDAEADKDVYEEHYFEKIRSLDAYGSVAALNAFVEASQDVVELKAQYQAREKLISYYDDLLVSLEARTADVEANEEALVKGVQVVDISGSDLDLIIDEDEF
jgi:hypothetical protein